MTGRRRAATLIALLASSACAPSMFQRHLDAHRWTDAARSFAADSSLQRNERALFRAALLYSMPGTPVYDPTVARTLLERMLHQYPESGQRATATHLLPLLQALEQAAARERQEWDLRAQVARLARQIDELHQERDSLRNRLATEQAQRESLEQAIIHLEGELRNREQQIRTLRTELDRLKAIDLRPPERPAATTPPPGEE